MKTLRAARGQRRDAVALQLAAILCVENGRPGLSAAELEVADLSRCRPYSAGRERVCTSHEHVCCLQNSNAQMRSQVAAQGKVGELSTTTADREADIDVVCTCSYILLRMRAVCMVYYCMEAAV